MRPAPAPAPATVTGTVTVVGDAVVELISGDTVYVPGELPVGPYAIMATFPGKSAREVGELVVTADKTVKLTCITKFNRCKVQ